MYSKSLYFILNLVDLAVLGTTLKKIVFFFFLMLHQILKSQLPYKTAFKRSYVVACLLPPKLKRKISVVTLFLEFI